jgi:hypothetical protein
LVDTINDEMYFDPFVYALYFLDQRHQVGFRYHQSGSPFEYDLVRLIYTKKREFDVWQQLAARDDGTNGHGGPLRRMTAAERWRLPWLAANEAENDIAGRGGQAWLPPVRCRGPDPGSGTARACRHD